MKQMKKSNVVTATLSRSTKLLACALALLTALAVVTVVQAQDKPEQLKLMLGDVSMNKLPFVMAYDEGIFKDNGLDLVPKFSRSSVEIIRKSGMLPS